MSAESPGDEAAALAADLRGWLEYHTASQARCSWGESPALPDAPSASARGPVPPRASASSPEPPSVVAPPAPRRGPPAPRFVREDPGPPPARGPSVVPPSVEVAAASASLPVLQDAVSGCVRCRLSEGRTQTVFGVGSPTADVMFVGEGPGFHEDAQGVPFVGAAGELLTRIINNVLRLDRADVYIANVVKCRPPNNRDPEPDEVEACSPFLWRQIELVQPVVVVALGRFAIQTLLQTSESVGRVRGRAHPFRGSVLVPTYHPAYLLRNPADKRKVFEDMKLVRAELEARTGRALPPIASSRPRRS